MNITSSATQARLGVAVLVHVADDDGGDGHPAHLHSGIPQAYKEGGNEKGEGVKGLT